VRGGPGAADPAVAAGRFQGSTAATSTLALQEDPAGPALGRGQVVGEHQPHDAGDSSRRPSTVPPASSIRANRRRSSTVGTSPPAPAGNAGGLVHCPWRPSASSRRPAGPVR
jgi:hypothetical protein